MRKAKDRASKKCINPWYQFLAIFCVAALTMVIIFEVDTNRIKFDFLKRFNKKEFEDTILIATTGDNPKGSVAVQFETCRNFIVVRESDGRYECYSNNPAMYDLNTVLNFIRQQNIEAVIAGTMNINTYQMLNSSHVEVYTSVTGTVEEALKKYKKHELVSYSRYYYDKRQNASLKNTGNITSVR